MYKTILIAGAPCVGKSFTARKLAEELKIPWISTDGIRGLMRKVSEKEKYPNLFYFDEPTLSAEKYLKSHSSEEILRDQNAETADVWKGVEAFISTDFVWKSFIVEGVAVLPELVSRLNIKNREIRALFLIDENTERIRDVVYKRGLWGDAQSYPDSVKEIEVRWVLLFNKYIKKEAEKFGYKTYNIVDREASFKSLLAEIKPWLVD